MTVSTTTCRKSYSCNGSQTQFPFDFRIYLEEELIVVLRDSSGDETFLLYSTDYTINDGPWPEGGTITTVKYGEAYAYAAGYTIVLLRSMEALQGHDYVKGDPFPAETHEEGLDRLVMLIQQVLEFLGRTPALSKGSPYSDLGLPDPEANKYLAWRQDLAGLKNVELMDAGTLTATSFGESLIAAADADAARIILVSSEGLSIKKFGATGNDIDDDTAKVQQVFDYAATNGYGAIDMREGCYKLTDYLDVPPEVSILGVSRRKCRFRQANSGKEILRLDASLHSNEDVFENELKNFTLDGDGNATAGLYIKGARHIKAENLLIYDCTTAGIQGLPNGSALFNVNRFFDMRISGCGKGVALENACFNWFERIWCIGCTTHSFYYDGGYGSQFIACYFEGGGVELIRDGNYGMYEQTFVACEWLDITEDGLVIPADVFGIQVLGGGFQADPGSPPAYGIKCDGRGNFFAPARLYGDFSTAAVFFSSSSAINVIASLPRMNNLAIVDEGYRNEIVQRNDPNIWSIMYRPSHYNKIVVFEDEDPTPDVTYGEVFKTANTAATTITDFILNQETEGKVITVIFGDALTTIQHNGTYIALAGGANKTFAVNDTLVLRSNGAVWLEISRSENHS